MNQLDLHADAWYAPHEGFESAIVNGIKAWLRYDDAHRARYGASIGDDPYTRERWIQWGLGLRGLLNCERGRLDGATCDLIIVTAMTCEGYNPDMMEWA